MTLDRSHHHSYGGMVVQPLNNLFFFFKVTQQSYLRELTTTLTKNTSLYVLGSYQAGNPLRSDPLFVILDRNNGLR